MTHVTTAHWELTRWSCLQQVQIPDLSIDTNGMVHLHGYANDGGGPELNQLLIDTLKLYQATLTP